MALKDFINLLSQKQKYFNRQSQQTHTTMIQWEPEVVYVDIYLYVYVRVCVLVPAPVSVYSYGFVYLYVCGYGSVYFCVYLYK